MLYKIIVYEKIKFAFEVSQFECTRQNADQQIKWIGLERNPL
jgi:hypothetical protein